MTLADQGASRRASTSRWRLSPSPRRHGRRGPRQQGTRICGSYWRSGLSSDQPRWSGRRAGRLRRALARVRPGTRHAAVRRPRGRASDQVHNTYLQLLAETGVVGLGLFLAVVWAALGSARRAARPLARLQGATELYGSPARWWWQRRPLRAAVTFLSIGSRPTLWVLLALGPMLLGVAVSMPKTRRCSLAWCSPPPAEPPMTPERDGRRPAMGPMGRRTRRGRRHPRGARAPHDDRADRAGRSPRGGALARVPVADVRGPRRDPRDAGTGRWRTRPEPAPAAHLRRPHAIVQPARPSSTRPLRRRWPRARWAAAGRPSRCPTRSTSSRSDDRRARGDGARRRPADGGTARQRLCPRRARRPRARSETAVHGANRAPRRTLQAIPDKTSPLAVDLAEQLSDCVR